MVLVPATVSTTFTAVIQIGPLVLMGLILLLAYCICLRVQASVKPKAASVSATTRPSPSGAAGEKNERTQRVVAGIVDAPNCLYAGLHG